jgi:hypothetical protein
VQLLLEARALISGTGPRIVMACNVIMGIVMRAFRITVVRLRMEGSILPFCDGNAGFLGSMWEG